jgi:hypothetical protein
MMKDKTKQYRLMAKEYYNVFKNQDGLTHITGGTMPFRPPESGDWWGEWCYLNNNTLTIYREDDDRWLYEIDLDRVPDSAAVLDWIAQVSAKYWCTPERMGYLVQALDDILELQQNYCGWGLQRRGNKLDCLDG